MTPAPTHLEPTDEACPICGTMTEDMRHVDVGYFYQVNERAPHLYARPRYQAVTPGPLYWGRVTRYTGGEGLHHRPAADQPDPGVTHHTSAWEPLPERDITLLEHTVYGTHCCKGCRADFIALFLAWSRGHGVLALLRGIDAGHPVMVTVHRRRRTATQQGERVAMRDVDTASTWQLVTPRLDALTDAGRRVLRGEPVIVGDLHGRADLLSEVLARFHDRYLIFLGDYVDRGPDSAGVIAQVRALVDAGRATALLGNHDEMMVMAAAAPTGWAARQWLEVYGQVTLTSYGGDWSTLQTDAAWLATLPQVYVEAGVLYAHALRPHPQGLDADPETPLWGRPSTAPLYPLPPGVATSVHGHTTVPHPQRVACEDGSHAWFIDTGAFHTGTLCALDTATWIPSLIQRPVHVEALAELDEYGPDAPGAVTRVAILATGGGDAP